MINRCLLAIVMLALAAGCSLEPDDPVDHAMVMLEHEPATFAAGKWMVRLCEFPDDPRVHPVILEHTTDERITVRAWALILLIRNWPDDPQTETLVRETAFDQRFPLSLREEVIAEARALHPDWWESAVELLTEQSQMMGRPLTRVQL